MGTALVRADRPMDMKLMGSVRDFAKAPKNHILYHVTNLAKVTVFLGQQYSEIGICITDKVAPSS